MKKISRKPVEYSQAQLGWTLAFTNISMLPLIGDVPIWPMLLLWGTSLWIWRNPGAASATSAWLRLLLTLSFSALVLYSFRTISGIEPGTSLLLVMATMKLLETRTVRDLLVLIFMSFFFVLANFLLDQSLWNVLLGLIVVWLGLCAIIQVNRRAVSEPIPIALRHGGGLLLQTLPLTLVLFVLFPRVPGPFWALPSVNQGQTGLSNEMEPGSISQLLQSSEVAFRVAFKDRVPTRDKMYFRGPVLEVVNGRKWSPRKFQTSRPITVLNDAPISYEITLEPHRQHWLLALDMPDFKSLPRNSRIFPSGQLHSDQRVTERTRVKLTSYLDYSFDIGASQSELAMNLDTSRSPNPDTQALAEQWRSTATSDQGVIDLALRYFNIQPFSYTLNPRALTSTNSVDQFMFDTQEGFCEHYASAFVLLMRHAGIPARVVTGYMGGEYNARSDHYTVRQSDAHAWAEVWLPSQGWIRIDPTGAVAPERVEEGISAAIGSMPSFILGDATLITELRQALDSLNALWNESVLGYSDEKQWSLLRKLGLRDRSISQLLALLLGTMIVLLAALAVYLRMSGAFRHSDPAVALFQRFRLKLAALGVTSQATEDPGDFGQRAARALPDQADAILGFSKLYEQMRYGRNSNSAASASDLKQLKSYLRALPNRPLFRQQTKLSSR